ncbi:putative cohesin complex subunit psm1 [Paratrimastix pyriformis]|uniref:Cohesin complex subunit psm1 n=1 Tax=Paratrimastix pyriformis TaxID=342808 RepID=A0ABQ8UC22_9EUKA|nr:putative cohesin complex subunit psm1 [Paratrimastix pyriformis]
MDLCTISNPKYTVSTPSTCVPSATPPPATVPSCSAVCLLCLAPSCSSPPAHVIPTCSSLLGLAPPWLAMCGQTAITVAMGKAMDAIVVEDEKTAKECIQYMREQRSGTATFLPLDTLRTKPIDDRLRLLGHDTRLATDLLQFETRFVKAISYACGNVVVCPTLDVARELCFGAGSHKMKCVALDGTLIHKSGLITGGRSGIERMAQRWEAKDVEALKRRRDRLIQELQEVNKVRKTARNEKGIEALLKTSVPPFPSDPRHPTLVDVDVDDRVLIG